MKPLWHRTVVCVWAVVVWSHGSRGWALSPYEALISSGKTTYVGLIAAAKPGQGAELEKALRCLACKKCAAALKRRGITSLSAHKKTLADQKIWYWVYFAYRGKDYLKAVNAFERAAPGATAFLEPHPRARTHGTTWLQMEWICYLPGVADNRLRPKNKSAVVTRIRPEKEEQYRTLHQTVWPGVSDQLVRAHNRNLSIFLVELGEEIYEFLYLEYVGENPDADARASKSDACTLRWWKLTDACQLPLPDVKEGIWSAMEAVIN